jgi:hypothetical protein
LRLKVTHKRLHGLIETLRDDNSELGPLDREDLRQVCLELGELRLETAKRRARAGEIRHTSIYHSID